MHLFAKTLPATPLPRFSTPIFTKALLSLAALSVLSLLGPGTARAAEPRVALAGAVSPQSRLRGAHLLGRLDAATPLRAALILPLRNQSGLQDLLRRQYTPGDSLYHHFLTPSDFTARFGPTPQDYAAVAAYARAEGLKIEATSPGRTLLSVSGPSARIESAFGVQMSRYRMADGRTVYANRAAPVLPRSVAVRLAGIAGLSSIAQMHPQLRRLQPHAPLPINGGSGGIGSGDLGGVTPNDIKYAYDLSAITPLYGTTAASTTATSATAGTLDGTGQSIGLLELDGFSAGDIAQYAGKFGLPTVLTGAAAPVTVIPLGGFKEAPLTSDGQTEVTLDIDMALALAPAATGIYVYEDNGVLPTDNTFDPAAPITIFTRMVQDTNPSDSSKPLVSVISCSWGIAETLEDPNIYNAENTLFQQMAAQGQSLFCASGDNGAYDLYTQTTTGTTTTTSGLTTPTVDNPASQPYATGVGGTTLSYLKPTTNATTGVVTPGTYDGETVWSAGTPAVNPEGSGGGISTIWSKPTYQLGVGASPLRRDVPDVSLNADPNTGYIIYVGSTATAPGVAEVIGGTSAAAPLWAAYTALINQQRAANGLTSTVGFLNPLLYPLAASSASYSADFHDITSLDNLFYYAGPGYDDASGLGSFVGAPLLAALSLNVNQGTGTATVSGSVTDASTPPVDVAGAVVTATSSATGAVVATATTDTSGAYTLSVPSGLALKIAVSTSAVTAPAPATEGLVGTSVTLAGLAADATATQNFTLAAAVHTYPAALQMISAPFDYTGIGDFATIFGLSATQAATSNPRLVQYAPSSGSYVFYPTMPADTLRLGQGYWVRFPTPGTLLAGTPLSAATFSIPLQQGWNQIGDPFELAVPLSSMTVATTSGTGGPLASTPAVVQATLYSYSTLTGAYDPLNPATDALNPYAGYWIYAFQACTLSVPNPGPPPSGGAPV